MLKFPFEESVISRSFLKVEVSTVIKKDIVLYGESLGKQYIQGVSVNCLIERSDSEANYEGFGFDKSQTVEYRFNRHTLEEKELYPEIGDVIFHNNGYFEIDNVREDYMLAGRTDSKFSITCSTFMMRRSQLNIEQRAV